MDLNYTRAGEPANFLGAPAPVPDLTLLTCPLTSQNCFLGLDGPEAVVCEGDAREQGQGEGHPLVNTLP